MGCALWDPNSCTGGLRTDWAKSCAERRTATKTNVAGFTDDLRQPYVLPRVKRGLYDIDFLAIRRRPDFIVDERCDPSLVREEKMFDTFITLDQEEGSLVHGDRNSCERFIAHDHDLSLYRSGRVKGLPC